MSELPSHPPATATATEAKTKVSPKHVSPHFLLEQYSHSCPISHTQIWTVILSVLLVTDYSFGLVYKVIFRKC